jgi:hypothetical protein
MVLYLVWYVFIYIHMYEYGVYINKMLMVVISGVPNLILGDFNSFFKFFLFCGAKDGTQGLSHGRKALYHCYIRNPVLYIFLLNFFKASCF